MKPHLVYPPVVSRERDASITSTEETSTIGMLSTIASSQLDETTKQASPVHMGGSQPHLGDSPAHLGVSGSPAHLAHMGGSGSQATIDATSTNASAVLNALDAHARPPDERILDTSGVFSVEPAAGFFDAAQEIEFVINFMPNQVCFLARDRRASLAFRSKRSFNDFLSPN